MQWKLQWKKKKIQNPSPNHVLEKSTLCVCMHTLNAYGCLLTRSVCCVTPVLRGHPSLAIWLCSAHQSWWKAGPWPSTMTDWRGARNSSPWLEAYRPGAGGWQGPAMRAWWMGSGTGLVMCVSLCVCASSWSGFLGPLKLDLSYRGNPGKGYDWPQCQAEWEDQL